MPVAGITQAQFRDTEFDVPVFVGTGFDVGQFHSPFTVFTASSVCQSVVLQTGIAVSAGNPLPIDKKIVFGSKGEDISFSSDTVDDIGNAVFIDQRPCS